MAVIPNRAATSAAGAVPKVRYAAPSRRCVSARSRDRGRKDLHQVRRRAADREHRRGRATRGIAHRQSGLGAKDGDLLGGRRVMGHVAPRQRRAPDRKATRARVGARLHDDHLDASAADIDDRQRRLDRPAGRRSEQVEQRLLLVAQDVERDARRRLDGRDDRAGVRGAAERLGADEGHVAGTEVTGALGVVRQQSDQLLAGGAGDRPPGVHGVSETEEDRLIGERVELVPVDGRDQQVDRVRADVDGAEDRVRCRRCSAVWRSGAGTGTRRATRGRGLRGGGLRAAAARRARGRATGFGAVGLTGCARTPSPRWRRPAAARRSPPRRARRAPSGGPRPRAVPSRGATPPSPRA